MIRAQIVPIWVGIFALSACIDSEHPLTPGNVPAGLHVAPPYQLPSGARTRRDTPWWNMSDADLAAAIAYAGGRAFIGFKGGRHGRRRR